MKYYSDNSFEHMQAMLDLSDCFICPAKLYLDITQDCNLHCIMCRDDIRICGNTMPMELFQRVVDETSPYVRSYSLFNWGEPLLLSDFRQRVEYVAMKKRPDAVIDISTNGMLLTQDMIELLHKYSVRICISFDGSDKETFESIRCGGNFGKIKENAHNAAVAYSDMTVTVSPGFYVSIQQANRNQLVQIAKLAHSIGIRSIGCGLVVNPEKYAVIQDEKLCSELEAMYDYAAKNEMYLETFPTKVGDYLLVGNSYEPAKDYLLSTQCNAAMLSASIAYDGTVYLCCNIGEKVGNVNDSSFLKLWQSKRYHDLRNQVNDKDKMSDRCAGCAWFNRN